MKPAPPVTSRRTARRLTALGARLRAEVDDVAALDGPDAGADVDEEASEVVDVEGRAHDSLARQLHAHLLPDRPAGGAVAAGERPHRRLVGRGGPRAQSRPLGAELFEQTLRDGVTRDRTAGQPVERDRASGDLCRLGLAIWREAVRPVAVEADADHEPACGHRLREDARHLPA